MSSIPLRLMYPETDPAERARREADRQRRAVETWARETSRDIAREGFFNVSEAELMGLYRRDRAAWERLVERERALREIEPGLYATDGGTATPWLSGPDRAFLRAFGRTLKAHWRLIAGLAAAAYALALMAGLLGN